MANPQAENGHIDIANEIAEALMKINLSAYESRVLWFLFRKTYGWKKKTDRISLSQFSTCIGLDRRLIHRAIKSLSSKEMIVIYKDDAFDVSYGFQKDYEKWNLSSKKTTVINRDDGLSSKEMMEVSSKEIPTKETLTKETLTKEINPLPPSKKEIIPDWVPKETFLEYLSTRKKKLKPESYDRFFNKLKKLADASRASPEEIIDQSIVNGWEGIFELKQGGNGNGSGRNNSASTGQAVKEAPRVRDAGYGDGAPYPVDCVVTE